MPRNPSTQKLASLRKSGTLNPRPAGVTNDLFRAGGEFFDPNDLLQVKYEMLRQVQVDGATVSETAPAFGFSRPSFYEAQAAFQQKGLHGLLPRKRGPQRAHKLDAKTVEFLEKLKQENPVLNSSQLAAHLLAEFQIKAHPRSIERALAREQKKRR
jgi:transposase